MAAQWARAGPGLWLVDGCCWQAMCSESVSIVQRWQAAGAPPFETLFVLIVWRALRCHLLGARDLIIDSAPILAGTEPIPMLDPRWVGSPAGSDFPAALVRFGACPGIEIDICAPHHPQQNDLGRSLK